jgi:hypothetical protein
MTNDSHNGEGENPGMSNELQRFAVELARLQPRSDRLDRERLAFLAGQASVVSERSRSAKSFGVRLESRAWPAAFAAMTTIAATLLWMLLTRPDAPGVPSIATNVHVQDRPSYSIESIGNRTVLTTHDVRLVDIETRMAKLDAHHNSAEAPPSAADDPARPVYTPSAWEQVIDETEPTKPLPRKSSSYRLDQGINT